VFFGIAAFVACRPTTAPPPPSEKQSQPDPQQTTAAGADAAVDAMIAAIADAGAAPIVESDPMTLHKETREELLALFTIKDFTDEQKKIIQPDAFLRGAFSVTNPAHINQGNKAIASHLISKEKCLAGLAGVTLQTPDQKAKCGADNMVPVWIKGKDPWFCIDIFEFPNKACELPFVWAPPTWDKKICELQGKRLCSDIEWNIACRGDPEGGADWKYAYGDKLDLTLCNNTKGHKHPCWPKDAQTTWENCATESEPSGSYPKCKSRFGVYDQHGNLAEVMMRREGDQVVTQLKGSSWYYNELAKEPNEPVPATTPNKNGAHPDHCNFDPRWHVEQLDQAQHVNYHLGFRCCKSIP
jgi:hypothetical protein